MTKYIRAIAGAFVLLGLSLSASAAIVETDDLIFDYDDSTLFGTLVVIDSEANTVRFVPTEFKAIAEGAAVDNAIASILVTVTIKDDSDFVFPGVQITETGDFVVGLPNGENGANSVRANLFTEVFGNGEGVLQDTFFEDETTPANPEDPNGTFEVMTSHTGISELSSIMLFIENSLNATNTEISTSSFIDKKGVEITFVPVPAAVWLFGSVLATLGLFRKRAQATA
ncbi:MAG: VPLPA-CTERM sorting domain-containing protein [Pseudomonadota bacterium]